MNQLSVQEFRGFGPLANAIESTDQGNRLYRALNCLLRPKNAIKSSLRYFRLWGIGSAATVETTLRALTFTGYPSGVGADGAARAANKTIAVRIHRQGKNFLFFYDLVNSKARGLFYMGDDGTYTSGAYNFAAGTPSFEVLAVGLNSTARWYGKRMATMLKLSNNVDDPVCVQLGRTATPGKWRVAGSNAKPAAAVISQVATASTTNVQARLSIQGNASFRVFPDHLNDRLFTYTLAGTFTVSATSDRLTINASGAYTPANGDIVIVASTGTIPAGLTAYDLYYVVQASAQTCALALTAGGSPIDITGGGAGTHYVARLVANPYADGDQVLYATTGSEPAGLDTKAYFVRDSSTWSFKLANSSGGAAVAFTTNGTTPVQQSVSGLSTTRRAGLASLIFTADATNYPGAAGNSCIKVGITFSAYATAITSARSGTGTVADPYIYTLTTGPSADASSTSAIVEFVNEDTLATGIITATASGAANDNAIDLGTWAAALLSGGSGTGTSEGFTNQTCSVYLRYFDAGNERCGYEGISSDLSNIIILDATTRSDILVTITTNPSAEGGRFGFIRVYFQFGEGAEAIWSLMGEVANTSGTKTLQLGSNTEIGQGMTVDQNRPLPFKATCMVRNQVWHGGNTSTPDVLYVSKAAVTDEIAPEGANAVLENTFTIAVPEQTSQTRVTALETDNFKVHVHTNQGLIMLDPENPDEDRHIPQVPVGALNPACVVEWEKSSRFYIGSDLEVYQFDGARYGKRDVANASRDAQPYVISKADLDAVAREPDRVAAWLDGRSQHLFYFFPGLADGTLTGFAFDFINSGIVGEFNYPKIYDATGMEPERPETVFCDEAGNLFYLDGRSQYDWSDDLGEWPAFTEHSTSDTPGIEYNGYGYVDYNGVRYYQALEHIFETGFIDLGSGSARKNFQGLMFSTVKGSRALVEATFTNKVGRSVTRTYGDIGSKGRDQVHKILAMLPGDAIKVKLRLISAEQAPWVIRNLSLLFRPAGQL